MAFHELSWRLGVLHWERHGVRLLLLVAPGRVVWAGALLFLVSPLAQMSRSYRRCGLSTVSSSPVSLRTLLEKIPLSVWLARALPHMEIWCIISLWPSYLPVVVAVFGCCLWRTIGFSGYAWDAMLVSTVEVSPPCLGVACGVRMDFRRDNMLRPNSWFDSGYMFCVIFERFFDEFHTFFHFAEDSYPAVLSPFSRRTEKCAQLMLQFTVFLRCSHIEIWTLFPQRSVADSGCDDFGHFCRIFTVFFAPLQS